MKRLDAEVSLMDMALYREDGKLEEIRKRTYLKPEAVQEEEHLLAKHFLHHMTGTDTFMFQSAFLRKIGGFPPIDLGDEFYLMEKAILHHGRISYLPRCDVKALVHREGLPGCRAGRERSVGKISCLRIKRSAGWI